MSELFWDVAVGLFTKTMSELAGPEEAAAPEEEGDGEPIPTSLELGDGNSVEIDPQALREVLYGPEVMGVLTEWASALVNAANEMAITEGAEYTFVVQTTEGYGTPQIYLYPLNFQAKIDDAAHSTLLKVAANVSEEVPVEVGEGEEVPIPVASPTSGQTGYLDQYWLPPGRSVWSKAEGR
jgi:hypothetical protein